MRCIARSDRAAELAEYVPQLVARLRRIAGPKVSDSVHFLMEFVVPAAK